MSERAITVVIVDDEPLAQEVLAMYLSKMQGFILVGKCRNAVEAFQLLNRESIDVLLLDINMPEISGIDFLKSLKNPPRVIFTTAYAEFAIESYDLDVVDYLLKPIAFERFIKAMNRVADLLQEPKAGMTKEAMAIPREDKLMFVRSEGKWIKIDLSSLWFAEGLKDYVRLWMNDGRITVHSTMKNFEEQVGAFPNFLRVHKSFIVNMDYVTEVNGNTIKIKDQQIAIGSTYKEDVQKMIDGYRLL